ncbi:MAG: hypothetical protein IIC72_09970 [Acidobacteria bacterium]|nr:hypothetical protein [Acidobacteriota bacterium]
MNGQLEARRVGLGAAAVGVLVLAMMAFSVLPASAGHINATGPLGSNCVNFQSNSVGTLSPTEHNLRSVSITLVSWDAIDGKSIEFTVSGLAAGQFVDVSVKSGTEIVEQGPFSNGGPHHVDNNGSQHQISHVRLCVFGTPTTAETTTTTIPDEVSPTSIVSTTTTIVTTTDPGVSPETLPFTGFESGATGLLALVLVGSGALALVGTRVFRGETDE